MTFNIKNVKHTQSATATMNFRSAKTAGKHSQRTLAKKADTYIGLLKTQNPNKSYDKLDCKRALL